MREICTSGSVRDGGGDVPIYSAFASAEWSQSGGERRAVGEACKVAEEGEPSFGMGDGEPIQEQPPEQAREHPHGQKEARPARDPAPAIERQAAAGHDAVDMRVVGERRSPYVDDPLLTRTLQIF